MADTWHRMPKILAAASEAISAIMGQPMLHLWQCAIAMDTWCLLVVSHSLILLGLVFNTLKLSVGMTKEYRQEVLLLMDMTWHPDHGACPAKEMEILFSKLGRIRQAYRPIYHLMPHMYAYVAYALRHNEYYLASTSRRFCKLIQTAKKNPRYLRIIARSISVLDKQLN